LLFENTPYPAPFPSMVVILASPLFHSVKIQKCKSALTLSAPSKSRQKRTIGATKKHMQLPKKPLPSPLIKTKVLLTNSNTPLVRELYASFSRNIIKLGSKRAINCKASKREGYTDLIIRNY
jgi:hypothetical protein